MERQRNIRHTLRETSNSVMESWTYRQKVLDQWRNNFGYFQGGGWLVRPDPSWHRLEPITL